MTKQTYRQLLDYAMREFYIETLGLSEDQLAISAKQRYDMVRGETITDVLKQEIGLTGRKVLDVGSGWGEITYKCLSYGANAYGVDPDMESLQVSNALIRSQQHQLCFSQGFGESLPFSANEFDLVICHHVLEHVQQPAKVIGELVRVTRPGGYIFLSFPNYIVPFEGHYRLPWIPFMPKAIGSLYLKALGRNPYYFQNFINYVTYGNVSSIIRQYPVKIRCLTQERLSQRAEQEAFWGKFFREVQIRLRLYKTVTFLLEKLPNEHLLSLNGNP